MEDSSTYGGMKKHGLLRLWVLNILSQRNLNGSEIIKEIEENSKGWWKPSPGSIYPLLSQLEKAEFVTRDDFNRYSITVKGKETIDKHFQKIRYFYNRTNPDDIESILENIDSQLMFILDSNLSPDGTEKQIDSIEEKLKEIKKRLSND